MRGIDLDEGLIAIAKSRPKSKHIHYEVSDALKLRDTCEGHFDFITCLEVLEHVSNPEAVISNISSLLKPGGHAFISTINRNLISFLGAIVAAEHILNIIPKNTHDYESLIKPSELILWANKCHLNLVDMAGIQYNPLDQSFSLNNHSSVNYITCFTRSSVNDNK